jgi:integrase
LGGGERPADGSPCHRPGRDRWLTHEEASRLIAAADAHSPAHIALFVRIALYLGARHGAILDLSWNRVDLDRRLILLNPRGRQQTAKRRPELPIPVALIGPLQQARAAAVSAHVIAWRGRPVKSVRRGFAAAVRAAGLLDVTPHTLRHTAGTWLAQAGVPLWTVAGFLGHGDVRTTARYAHHAPQHLRQAAAAMDVLVGAA